LLRKISHSHSYKKKPHTHNLYEATKRAHAGLRGFVINPDLKPTRRWC